MHSTKLQFSPQEMALASDPHWILTKNEILQKIGHLLGYVHQSQKNILSTAKNLLPEKVVGSTPKISRGENYKGLPHLVLDYPRLFKKNNIFAIRSLFWWGRTLSTTLHLSGEWKQTFSEKIIANYPLLSENGFVVSIGANEWIHDVSSDEYAKTNLLSPKGLDELITKKDFVKLALFRPVSELNNAGEVWVQQFQTIIKALT